MINTGSLGHFEAIVTAGMIVYIAILYIVMRGLKSYTISAKRVNLVVAK